jgi:glucokinase
MLQNQPPVSPSHTHSPCFVGIDVGETYLTAGVVDDSGHPLASITATSDPAKGPEDTLRRVAEIVAEVIQKAGVAPSTIGRVGLGLPGAVDAASGKLVDPIGFPAGWDGFPIRHSFSTCCGRPASIFHNATAAAYGEIWLGAARKLPSAVLLTLGANVGCGVIFGEASIDGQSSFGIESAHMIIDCADDAPVCSCGQRGHLEAYIRDAAILDRVRRAIECGHQSSIAKRIEQGQSLTVDLLTQEAAAGDALSLEIVAETARRLGIGIVNIMNTIDPDGVLLGGTTNFGGKESPLGRQFLQWVKEEVTRRSFASLVERTVIDFAALNGDAVYLGAAGLARLETLKK